MIARRSTRTLALAGTATVLLGASAASAMPDRAPAPKKITAAGVDGVKLGRTFQQLRGAHLVGKLLPGCVLAGPSARSSRLKAPLKGSVDFTTSAPRKAAVIVVTGGAKARGVGVGATKAKVKQKFPKVKFDNSLGPTFGITIGRVPKNGGGKLEFAIKIRTGRVSQIGIPRLAFCE
jgi:hypothetical protein